MARIIVLPPPCEALGEGDRRQAVEGADAGAIFQTNYQSRPAHQHRNKETIRSRRKRRGAEKFAHAGRRRGAGYFMPRFGGGADGIIRMAGEERRHAIFILAHQQRTGGIDDTRGRVACGFVEQRILDCLQFNEPLRRRGAISVRVAGARRPNRCRARRQRRDRMSARPRFRE